MSGRASTSHVAVGIVRRRSDREIFAVFLDTKDARQWIDDQPDGDSTFVLDVWIVGPPHA